MVSSHAKASLQEWLGRAFTDRPREVDDIHSDELVGPWANVHDGIEWVMYGCEAIKSVRAAFKTNDNLHGLQLALIAFPLADSRRIRLWKDSDWYKVGMSYEPPSIILTKNKRFFEHYDEEYYRKIAIPAHADVDIIAVYRSQRSFEPLSDPNFGNTVFLVATFSALETSD
ncbi:MAG: hypothetical protein QOJ39_2055 [Candidatus Eremiobacteraeota bacterium]|jgi:hypothetical protein|nr:hypothetical protein [Candidatus Eremiobacteraeota bacterium]